MPIIEELWNGWAALAGEGLVPIPTSVVNQTIESLLKENFSQMGLQFKVR